MYKPIRAGTKWHVVNQKGWVSLICEKKTTAKMMSILFNDVNFDEITDVKRAKTIHDQIAGLAQLYDGK